MSATASSFKRILVVRPDRLGDVVLSLPVIEALRDRHPRARITMLVRGFVAPIVERAPGVDEVIVYDPEGRHEGFGGTFALAEELKRRSFDLALSLQASFPVSLAVWRSRIPVRIGPLHHWYTYLFFNRGVRQRRSQVRMHEAEYNIELAVDGGAFERPERKIVPRLAVSEAERASAAEWLASHGIARGDTLIGVHAGMGGSALNWPEENYAKLSARLLDSGFSVLLTSGPEESALIARLRSRIAGYADKREGLSQLAVYSGSAVRDLRFLAALQSLCRVFVAPSTGPLHLAGAVGTPTVSFYPLIPVQSPKRWGPYTDNASHSIVLTPVSESGMTEITVESALEAVKSLLR